MKLQPGERLSNIDASDSGTDPVSRIRRKNASIYVVQELVTETPWYALYRAKKIFRNVRGEAQDLEEVDQAEWLNVLVKTIKYTRLDDRDYVKSRRDQVWFEAKKVLGCRDTNLLPEPLDYLEVRNTHDSFAFPRSGQINNKEPVLVYENVEGQPLAKWYVSQKPDPLRVLSVLAEILEFLKVVHDQGLVANTVNSGAFWIDDADRVYHMATDGIVAAAANRVISCDRFPQGFAPPEAFQERAALDRRSDIYSWAALGYFLLCGDSPAKIAAEQRERHATFDVTHKQRLASCLRSLSATSVAIVASRFEVTSPRFTRAFPDSLVQVLMLCLSGSMDLRPGTVDVLRGWFAKAPPPCIPNALAVRSSAGAIEIVIDIAGLDPSLAMVIRKMPTDWPSHQLEGSQIYEGPLTESVLDPSNRPQKGSSTREAYSVFCRDRDEATLIFSPATRAIYVDLQTPNSVSTFLEGLAAEIVAPADLVAYTTLPGSLNPLAKHHEVPLLVHLMLASSSTIVRRWAISLVDAALRFGTARNSEALSRVLWDEGLADSSFDVRLATAKVIFQGNANPSASLIERVSRTLGGTGIDDRIRAVRALTRCGVSFAAIQAAIKTLEADRIVHCGVCQKTLKARELDDHLRSVHGYVDVESKLLPLGTALSQLWPRLFDQYDPSAAGILDQLMINYRETAENDFSEQCERLWLPTQTTRSGTEQERHRDRLARCLRAKPLVLRACWRLVSSENGMVRDVGREALLPSIANRLGDDDVTVDTFRKCVDALNRGETLDGKIRTCARLSKIGASLLAAERCAQDYELDREVTCSQCRAAVSQRHLAKHERLAHNRYIFGGKAFEMQELVQHLCVLLITGSPTIQAALLCHEILEERFGEATCARRFAEALSAALQALPPDREQFEVLELAASVLAQLPAASKLILQLLSSKDAKSGELAMAMISTDIVPTSEQMLETAVPALERGNIDEHFRGAAVASLLPKLHSQGPWAEEMLRAVVKPLPDKLAAIERLRKLQCEIGRWPAIDVVCLELEGTMRVQCPRCHAIMSGSEMRAHAQTAHRLVWEGRQLRQPWNVAEDCLEQYEGDRNRESLRAGEHFATLAGGEEFRQAFMRMVLRRGFIIDEYVKHLDAQAATIPAMICGSCFEFVPSPRSLVTMPIEIDSQENLTSEFLVVTETSTLLQNEPEIVLRKGAWTGRQPPSYFSRQGVFILLGATLVTTFLVTSMLAFMGLGGALALFAGWGVIATLGLFLAAAYRPSGNTALSIAWRFIVPELIKGDPDPSAIAFLAGLTKYSESSPDASRERHVLAAAKVSVSWYVNGQINYSLVALISRLLLIDQGRNDGSGSRAVSTLASLISEWSQERLPLNCLDLASADGELIARLSPVNQRRLRWQMLGICQQAGLHPFEVDALRGASKMFRSLLDSPEPLTIDHIALVFAVGASSQTTRTQLNAHTVLQNAHDGSDAVFESSSDIAAVSRDGDFRIGTLGLFYRDMHLPKQPTISIATRTEFVQTGWTHQCLDGTPDLRFKSNPPIGYDRISGYNLMIDWVSHLFDYDPSNLAKEIQLWSAYYFADVEPKRKSFLQRPAFRQLSLLALGASVRCQACGKTQDYVEGKMVVESKAAVKSG